MGRQPIEKFTWTRMNSNFQLSNGEALGLGGTTDEAERKVRPPPIARALPCWFLLHTRELTDRLLGRCTAMGCGWMAG